MAKNTDSSIKLLVLYDILLKSTDEEHALSTNEIIEELKKRGISVSRKVLPSDIDLLNKYGYEICSYVKKARYYYAVHQLFDTAEITMLTDVIKASKLTDSRKETIINKLYSTIGVYKDAATDNIIFLDAKKYGNSSIIYNIDAIETAIKQKKKVSFVYFHLGVFIICKPPFRRYKFFHRCYRIRCNDRVRLQTLDNPERLCVLVS